MAFHCTSVTVLQLPMRVRVACDGWLCCIACVCDQVSACVHTHADGIQLGRPPRPGRLGVDATACATANKILLAGCNSPALGSEKLSHVLRWARTDCLACRLLRGEDFCAAASSAHGPAPQQQVLRRPPRVLPAFHPTSAPLAAAPQHCQPRHSTAEAHQTTEGGPKMVNFFVF